jgi:predicted nucleotidyltransferase
MVDDTIITADKILRELFKLRSLKINKIVFYGSQIEKNADDESDLDVMVISEDFEEKDIFSRVDITAGIHRRLVEKLLMPVDIMYFSLSEWNDDKSIIISAAKEQGISVQ